MKFLMISKCGEGAGLLSKIKDEGNSCRIWIREKDYQSVYDGILEKAKTPLAQPDEIVIFDSSGMGDIAEKLSRTNLVFGASNFHDKLENNRSFGLEFMKRNGIQIPKTYTFEKTEFKQAEDMVNHSEIEKFVFKPSGDLPSHLTYIGEDAEDLIYYMNFVKRFYYDRLEDFVLQEFIEGTIVSSEFWVGHRGFITPANQTVEVKKFMNDDLGPATGCQGNLVWPCHESPILDQGILRVESDLIRNNYIGSIDLNCIFNEDGVYGLEWTPRFGLDAMPTFLQLISGDVGKLISDIVHDQIDSMTLKAFDYSAGVRISIPPFPLEPPNSNIVQKVSPNLNIPLRFLEDYEENYYFYEVMFQDDELTHSQGTGVIAVISVAKDDCEEAFHDCYRILDEVKIPNKQYRTDLFEVLPDMRYKIEEEEKCLV